METEILKYLSKYIPITEDVKSAVKESAFVRSFKKGAVLLEQGGISNECFFVLKGCIRSYCVIDGEEKTIEFYTEEQSVTPASYGKKTASKHYLECVEDTIASVGSPELETVMYQKYPQLESVTRVIADIIMSKYQDNFAEFKMASPEDRYLNLLKSRPYLFQRVPQHQIASYLGIKPESLSRIRKRIMNQKD